MKRINITFTPNAHPKPCLCGKLLKKLEKNLPDWHFEPYGYNIGRVACFPPKSVSIDAFKELCRFAVVEAVCGPFYVAIEKGNRPTERKS